MTNTTSISGSPYSYSRNRNYIQSYPSVMASRSKIFGTRGVRSWNSSGFRQGGSSGRLGDPKDSVRYHEFLGTSWLLQEVCPRLCKASSPSDSPDPDGRQVRMD